MLLLTWKNKNAYWRLMRADKPIGIYLLLWPTIWALLLASSGYPPWDITLVFMLGVIVMRSAGCVINDYADRKVDGSVERTKARPLISGEVSPNEALQLFALLILIAFGLVLMLNWQTILLSVGALVLASIYPFMKRYTHLPQVFLGAAFSWAIPMAFMAITLSLPAWLWLLYIANLCWTVAYDTQYAIVDREDDLKVGIKSSAILFGRYDLLAIAFLQGLTVALLVVVAQTQQLNLFFYISLVGATLMFVKQAFQTRTRDRGACFKAFLENHIIGMIIATGIAASYWSP
jgi:4-hydroxybenzoate polyprenyltransferase